MKEQFVYKLITITPQKVMLPEKGISELLCRVSQRKPGCVSGCLHVPRGVTHAAVSVNGAPCTCTGRNQRSRSSYSAQHKQGKYNEASKNGIISKQ